MLNALEGFLYAALDFKTDWPISIPVHKYLFSFRDFFF